jgi:hypothetical protein
MDILAIGPCRRITTKPLLFTVGLIWILSLVEGSLAATPTVPVEPCSLLTLEEVGAVLHGTATQDRPHVVKINKVPVGGNCVYRSAQNKLIVINLMVDANPSGHQQKAFDMGRQRPHTADVAGLGDRAFTVANPNGPPSITFLRGMILVTINAQGLGINDVKQLASIAAGRLPVSGGGPAASKNPAPTSPPPTTTAMQGSGKLDPALVGSWFLKQPSGRGIANIYVERDGRFSMTLLAGNKQQSGKIDGGNGVLHLYPDRGGHPQELKYKVIDKNQMEWTDQKGNVTIVRRQFR